MVINERVEREKADHVRLGETECGDAGEEVQELPLPPLCIKSASLKATTKYFRQACSSASLWIHHLLSIFVTVGVQWGHGDFHKYWADQTVEASLWYLWG